MNIFGKCSNDFFRGLGAEFVFQTTDGISIVSGGKVLKVRLLAPNSGEAETRVVLEEEGGRAHEIYRGNALSAAAKFAEIGRKAIAPRSRVSVSRKGAYLALAAFTAVYLVFCHPAVGPAPTVASTETSQNDLGELLKTIPALAGGNVQGLGLPALGKAGIPAGATSQPKATDIPGVHQDAAILDKPDFLNLPEDDKSATAPAKDKSAAADPVVPAYSPDLYKDKPKTADVGAPPAATAPVVAASAPAQPVAEPVKVVEPAAAAKTPEVIVAAKDPAPVAPPAPAQAAAAPSASDSKPTEVTTAETKKVATEAAKGKSAADQAAMLAQIQEMMKMDPGAITPEMLDKLPHEMAQILRQTGVIDSPSAMPEKGDAPYAAIRLPEGVIEKFRGKDGIASIPENDSYAALGNKIPLQLPGGGDIRKPEDLKLFGFKP